MITHIRHTGLVVASLDSALHFWCDVLGFRVAKRMEESGPHMDAMMGLEGVNVTTVKLAAPDGNLIELLHFHSHPDRPAWTGMPHSTGFTHVALTVTDLDALCAKLATIGATFSAPPQYSPDGAVKVTYCRGPEGVLLELVEVLEDGTEAAGKDWHSTQNAAYLDLLESRLKEPRLHWVDQFVGIINNEVINGDLIGESIISINDYGCNVGHFYRGIDSIKCAVDYRGFDISDTYLSIARRVFGRQHFHHLDLEQNPVNATWPQSNVAVISATLEHLENYGDALGNILSQTKNLVILRTFVGKVSLMDKCRTIGANADHLVRQFTIDDLTKMPEERGWKYKQEIDQATLGKTKLVCNGNSVPRTQTVIVFTKSESKVRHA